MILLGLEIPIPLLIIGAIVVIFGIVKASEGKKKKDSSSDSKIRGKNKKIVQTITGQSFFALCKAQDGSILAGTYSHPNSTSKIVKVGGGTIATVSGGESVFAMKKFGDKIFISTEDEGKIFRMKNNKASSVYRLSGGIQKGAFGMFIAKGNKLIFVGGGEIFIHGIGSVHKFSKDYYVKNGFEFNGKAYVVGYKKSSNSAGWFVSNDLRKWVWKDVLPNQRFISGRTAPNGGSVVLVGSANYAGGKHHRNSASSYLFKGGKPQRTKIFNGYDYASCCTWNGDQALIGLSRGWKSRSSGCALATLTVPIATFSEAETRDILVTSGTCYIATRTHGVRGKVYTVN